MTCGHTFCFQIVEPVVIDQCVMYEVCIEQWPSHNYRVLYASLVLIIMALLPPLVVGTVHAKIARFLNKHAKTQKNPRRAQKELDRNQKTTYLLCGEFTFNSSFPSFVCLFVYVVNVICLFFVYFFKSMRFFKKISTVEIQKKRQLKYKKKKFWLY